MPLLWLVLVVLAPRFRPVFTTTRPGEVLGIALPVFVTVHRPMTVLVPVHKRVIVDLKIPWGVARLRAKSNGAGDSAACVPG